MTQASPDPAEAQSIDGPLLLVSALLGAAVAYLAFVLWLQTPVASAARLLAALLIFLFVSISHDWIASRWLRAARAAPARTAGAAVLLAALFFPLLYRSPAYPVSPLLRPWSDLAVQFEVPPDAPPLVLASDDIRLVSGKQALNVTAFQQVGAWQALSSGLKLAPGSTASLRWNGTLPETVTLTIQPPGSPALLTVYWDEARTTSELQAGAGTPILINHKASLPWGFGLLFAFSGFIVAAWLLAAAALLLGPRLAQLVAVIERPRPRWGLLVLALLLAVLTVKLQVDSLDGGLQYLAGAQVARHAAVLHGQAPDPWQYRPLSEFVAEGLIRLLGFLGPQASVTTGFLALRLLQNTSIFLAAFALYRRLAGSRWLALLGVLLLTASMSRAFYDNDLSFNTYFDLLFYLLAVLLLLSRHYSAVVILMVFAALNRETSGLIPFVMAGAVYGDHARPGFRKYMPVLASLAVFIAVFASLHLVYPARPLYVPYHHAPGLPLLTYNLARSFTWQQLLTTLGLAPFVGLLFFRSWPTLWQRLSLIIGPTWFLVHSFASVMAETRLFLVPQAILFIPAALFGLYAWLGAQPRPATTTLHSHGAS